MGQTARQPARQTDRQTRIRVFPRNWYKSRTGWGEGIYTSVVYAVPGLGLGLGIGIEVSI